MGFVKSDHFPYRLFGKTQSNELLRTNPDLNPNYGNFFFYILIRSE